MKRSLLLLPLATIVSFFSLALMPAAYADPAPGNTSAQQQICGGIGLTTTNGDCGDNGAQFTSIISAVINLLLIVIGVVAVIVIIIAGFSFITSGGDSGKVATAKNTIIYAVIGLVVVMFAEVIVHFVINTAQGN